MFVDLHAHTHTHRGGIEIGQQMEWKASQKRPAKILLKIGNKESDSTSKGQSVRIKNTHASKGLWNRAVT